LICAGDNFFKPASYMIEAMCAKSYEETTERLKEIESKILAKRNDLRQFETEYRKVSNYVFILLVIIIFGLFIHLNNMASRLWHDFKKSPTDIRNREKRYAYSSLTPSPLMYN